MLVKDKQILHLLSNSDKLHGDLKLIGDRQYWAAAERLDLILRIYPQVTFDPSIQAPSGMRSISQTLEACAAGVFVLGAALLWRHKEEKDEDDDGGRDGVRDAFWPVFSTAFAVVFLAEFGDLTQFLTVSLAARYHDPLAVGIGATLALWVAAGAAVLVGWRLLKFIPVKWLTRVAAVIMLALAGTSAWAAAS